MTVCELSRRDARRIAVRAQRLDTQRPNGLLDVPFDSTMTAAVDGEIKDLARWLEVTLDR